MREETMENRERKKKREVYRKQKAKREKMCLFLLVKYQVLFNYAQENFNGGLKQTLCTLAQNGTDEVDIIVMLKQPATSKRVCVWVAKYRLTHTGWMVQSSPKKMRTRTQKIICKK